MAISRRTLINSILGLSLASPALGGRAFATARMEIIQAVEAYLNDVRSLETRFTQIAPNGQLSAGLLQLQRPGQLKMDYDRPSRILLVAPGDWRLIFYDGSIQQVNTIPLGQTPLGVLLDEQIRLDDDIEVLAIEEMAGELSLTLARSGVSELGTVTLVFSQLPLELRRWTVIDGQGLATTIILEDLKTDVDFATDNFRWRDPKIFGFPEE